MNDKKLQEGDIVKSERYDHVVVDETFVSPTHGLRIKGHTYIGWDKKKVVVDYSECEVMG